jgi:Domain of unknown function (DUF5667)
MSSDHRIDAIIDQYLPALMTGQETITSILEKHPQDATELRPRLESLTWLVDSRKNLDPRPGFISSSRKYIEHKVGLIQPQNFWQRAIRRYTPQRWVFNIVAPAMLIVLLVLVLNSIVLSAQLSIPGDPLYSTKITLENVQLAFTFNQVEKADLYIQLSRERTTELVELALEGNYELIPSAARRMEMEIIASLHALNNIGDQYQTSKGPMLSELRGTLTNEIYVLNLLESSSPPAAHQGIELAIQTAQSGLMALH